MLDLFDAAVENASAVAGWLRKRCAVDVTKCSVLRHARDHCANFDSLVAQAFAEQRILVTMNRKVWSLVAELC